MRHLYLISKLDITESSIVANFLRKSLAELESSSMDVWLLDWFTLSPLCLLSAGLAVVDEWALVPTA